MSETFAFESFPNSNIAEESALSAAAAKDQNQATLENVDGFNQTNAIVAVGRPGAEKTEKAIVSSFSGQVLTFADNLSFAHLKGDGVYRVRSNQVKIYRASNVDGTAPADGSFSVLAVVDIQFDQLQTEYVDTAGSDSYWYKITYYNSLTTSETSLTDSIAVRGGNSGRYTTVEAIRKEAAFDKNPHITDALLDTYRKFAQARIDSSLSKAGYTLPLASVPILIESLNIKLAAGYALRAQVLRSDQAVIDQGNKLVEEAEAMLAKIESGDIVLLDATGTLLTSTSPIVSTAFDDIEPEDAWFTRDTKY